MNTKFNYHSTKDDEMKSKLEEKVAAQILDIEGEVCYEPYSIPYVYPATTRRYTPDFLLKNGMYIEVKDAFMSKDRKKHIAFRDSNPDCEIRFVFNNPNRKTVSDQGKPNKHETCKSWCDKNGFKYSAKIIPLEWFEEGNDA